jgi:molybdopterin converting factor small subunit
VAKTSTVNIRVPGPLRHYCRGAESLRAGAGTVRDALQALSREEPALYACVCDETGAVRRHVNLFVNNDHIHDLKDLDSALAPGDELIILPSVSGG